MFTGVFFSPSLYYLKKRNMTKTTQEQKHIISILAIRTSKHAVELTPNVHRHIHLYLLGHNDTQSFNHWTRKNSMSHFLIAPSPEL